MTDYPDSWTDVRRDAVALIRATLRGDIDAEAAITRNAPYPRLLATATAICAVALAAPAPVWPGDPREKYVHVDPEVSARLEAALDRLVAALNRSDPPVSGE